MPNEPTGGGNPNFFTTYKGLFALEPAAGATIHNSTLMLSIVNDVQFTGSVDLTGYVAGSAFATLPATCRPTVPTMIPVVVTEPGTPSTDPAVAHVSVLTVGADGALTLPLDWETATVHLAGVSFNITNNFYQEVQP